MSLQPWIVGILVFGGVDGVTGMDVEKNAFEIAFTTECNIEAWEKFCACPLTRACLESDKVRHKDGNSDDPLTQDLTVMQLKNNMAVWQLIYHGHRGDLLRAQLQAKTAEAPRTVAHSQ